MAWELFDFLAKVRRKSCLRRNRERGALQEERGKLSRSLWNPQLLSYQNEEGSMHPVSSNSEILSRTEKAVKDKKEEQKILIVDDEPFILKSLSFVLMKEGFKIETATNGLEAMEKIKKNKPDIVFLDIMMPKMNGMEVCQWIRQDPILKNIYVIILTAKGQEMDREKGFSIGADEYMTKPFSPSSVVQRIKEILQ